MQKSDAVNLTQMTPLIMPGRLTNGPRSRSGLRIFAGNVPFTAYSYIIAKEVISAVMYL